MMQATTQPNLTAVCRHGRRQAGRTSASSRRDARPAEAVQCQRREALLTAATTLLLAAVHPQPAAATAAPAAAAIEAPRDPQFYSTWPYAQPADILPFIRQQAAPGDAQAVLDAMDEFSQYYPQYKIGPEKGALFEGVLRRVKPTWALEVGSFLGYSAVRTARNLQPNGHLLCVEANPQNAAVARQVVAYAGFSSNQVQVLDGLSSQVLPQLPALLSTLQAQQQQEGTTTNQPPPPQQHIGFDFVFLDHCKECYLPDLQLLEQLGLVRQGTTVMSDNVIYPGAPGFLEFLDSSGRYTTQLLRARYEHEQPWNPSWEPNKEDAMSVSLCTASLA